jgi:hypothetical protein
MIFRDRFKPEIISNDFFCLRYTENFLSLYPSDVTTINAPATEDKP